MAASHFAHLSADGYLDCFSLLLVMLNAVNIHDQVFLCGQMFSSH